MIAKCLNSCPLNPRRGGPSGLATPIFSLSPLEPKSLRMIFLTIILVQVLCCLYQSPKYFIEIWYERPFSLQHAIVNEFELATAHSDKKRFRGNCGSLGCPWIIRARTQLDGSVRVFSFVLHIYVSVFAIPNILLNTFWSTLFSDSCRFKLMRAFTIVHLELELPVQWHHSLGWQRGCRIKNTD